MAELDVGKQCDIESCKQKDFLPFVCSSCSGVFCVEHRARDTHCCPEVPVKREISGSGGSKSHPCSFEDCKARELLPVICPHCEKHFCLGHRHQDDHKCEKLETPKPRMAATQELVQKIVDSKKNAPASKGRKGAKNAATAAKVALMKLKMHASGDKGLPQTERTYFQVFLPKEAKDLSLPMFFSSKWSSGKVVDFAASQAGLKNNNNVLTAKKLRLCHPETGEAFKMDACLQSLLSHAEHPLHNGGNVILEYLDNESSRLDDITDYIPSV
ncbi:AN1-type zinc finger protein 1 isoform X1 [Triplophysa rosa]|uniref:AN1-type zinc finger protein 1 n=1 Tax=Triplophysa rosa TaxID=992332 RepID=A0A9W7T637_TRIRA|nr:AN1-type zinc finger protein 1 isoform X1 [Triplophysa rosa]KAI7792415.1 AN1-type zinc finger protein 1 [Triplophysa rosa]